MSLVQSFPLFSIVLGLLCAVVCFVTPKQWGRRITLALLLASCVMQGWVLRFCYGNQAGYTYQLGHYPAPWGSEITAGLLEPGLGLLCSAVMLLAVIGGGRHIGHDVADGKQHLYWVAVDLTLSALLAMCYTNDIFTAYVFIEICTISACALLAVREGGRSLIASVRYMVFALIGSSLFLIGVVFTYAVTGQLLFPQLREAVAALWAAGTYRFAMTVAIALMTAGLAVKSGCFPFHGWLPDAHSQATTASSCILSGVIVKGYAVLLIKIIYRAIGAEVFMASGAQHVLLLLGIGGMVGCSIDAIFAKRLKVMIAFSSAAQIGYLFMGIGMGTAAGLTAALLQIVNHAITKPMLFLSGSQLADASHGRMDFPSLRGAGHRNVPAGILFTIGAVSMVGVPLLAGFIPKLYFAREAFALGWQRWPVLLGLAVSTVLNVLYFLYTAVLIWLPQEADCRFKPVTPHWDEFVPGFVLAGLNVAMGIHPGPLVALIEKAVALLGR